MKHFHPKDPRVAFESGVFSDDHDHEHLLDDLLVDGLVREQQQQLEQQLERQLRDRQETRSRYLLSFSYFLPFKLITQSSIIHVVKV